MKPLKFTGLTSVIVNGDQFVIPVFDMDKMRPPVCLIPVPHMTVYGHEPTSAVVLDQGMEFKTLGRMLFHKFDSEIKEGTIEFKIEEGDFNKFKVMPVFTSVEDFKTKLDSLYKMCLPSIPYKRYIDIDDEADNYRKQIDEKYLRAHPQYRGLQLKEESMTLKELLEYHAEEMFARFKENEKMKYFFEWLFGRKYSFYYGYTTKNIGIVRLSCLIMSYVMFCEDLENLSEHEITPEEINDLLSIAMREDYPAYLNYNCEVIAKKFMI